MKHACPVCAFDEMPFPPEDHNICPCCGTEFGYHDRIISHRDLRRKWIENGCPWFSRGMSAPKGWSPLVQMLNAGFTDVGLVFF
jgi:hypothetical protein